MEDTTQNPMDLEAEETAESPALLSAKKKDARPKLNPNTDLNKVAKRFASENKTDGLPIYRRWRERWYQWLDGCYRAVPNEDFKSLVRRWVNEKYQRPDNAQINHIYQEVLSILTLYFRTEPNTWIGPDLDRPEGDLICFRNGISTIENLIAGKPDLIPPTPRFFNIANLDFDLPSKDTRPVQWIRFLDSSLDDRRSIEAIQDFFGYCLTDNTHLQKFLFLYGIPRSGKGTIGRTIQLLIGENATATSIENFATNFGKQNLIGKNLAILGDVRANQLKSDERNKVTQAILGIVGEDVQNIPRKYQSDWVGRLPTKLMLLSNEMPKLSDGSGALATRAIIVRFEKSFAGKEDVGLEDKLRREHGGIFWWAVEGLKRIIDRREITEPTYLEEMKAEMESENNHLHDFIGDCCEFERDPLNVDLQVSKDRLYEVYRLWCTKSGIKGIKAKQTFAKDLKNNFGISDGRKSTGNRERVFQGIKLIAEIESNPNYFIG